MADINVDNDGFSLMARTCQQVDEQEQQLIQQIDRVGAYRQILIATLEQLPEGTRIDIKARDLLKILADDI
ncbi:hypothetical protein AFK20_01705 [Enhydrobacter aerosaccus]|uniref:Uncharacterized protein n=1 Tax=Enhydrobacter aerosaccus TaxID=225324 RepID=A0ABR5IP26_9HYPH|nr:hypothetical protein [Enhydrobacter aerosaccus]KND22837.1 hypothetical protein AFK20_01705 [Enhydrobacter aerosaccus]